MQNRKRHRCTEQTLGLWEEARVGCSERIALKQVYYQGWNRSPAQVGCMRQVPRAGTLRRPRGMGWGGRWEGGSGWGTHVSAWLIHVNAWQKPLQYCKVISLQLIKINGGKKKEWWSRTDVARTWWVGKSSVSSDKAFPICYSYIPDENRTK